MNIDRIISDIESLKKALCEPVNPSLMPHYVKDAIDFVEKNEFYISDEIINLFCLAQDNEQFLPPIFGSDSFTFLTSTDLLESYKDMWRYSEEDEGFLVPSKLYEYKFVENNDCYPYEHKEYVYYTTKPYQLLPFCINDNLTISVDLSEKNNGKLIFDCQTHVSFFAPNIIAYLDDVLSGLKENLWLCSMDEWGSYISMPNSWFIRELVREGKLQFVDDEAILRLPTI